MKTVTLEYPAGPYKRLVPTWHSDAEFRLNVESMFREKDPLLWFFIDPGEYLILKELTQKATMEPRAISRIIKQT